MTAKTRGADTKKMPGWYSWRHQTSEPNRLARVEYQATRGKDARRARAADRYAAYPLCERHNIRTPECRQCLKEAGS